MTKVVSVLMQTSEQKSGKESTVIKINLKRPQAVTRGSRSEFPKECVLSLDLS